MNTILPLGLEKESKKETPGISLVVTDIRVILLIKLVQIVCYNASGFDKRDITAENKWK